MLILPVQILKCIALNKLIKFQSKGIFYGVKQSLNISSFLTITLTVGYIRVFLSFHVCKYFKEKVVGKKKFF